ncbi:DUF7344 domain-containing protein [Halorarius halobius]|uniref:DUF7344 domain-containing protein n=1 Tax=Halorarius halobius TaxID=2962671 RepID=UPI0020CD20F8|nr:hypothetical protein [Halorarius halobius]
MSRSERSDGASGQLPERVATLLAGRPARREEYARFLTTLRDAGGACRLGTLAREFVGGGSPAAYREGYLRLRREHVPTLVTLGVVEYDPEDGTVRLREE